MLNQAVPAGRMSAQNCSVRRGSRPLYFLRAARPRWHRRRDAGPTASSSGPAGAHAASRRAAFPRERRPLESYDCVDHDCPPERARCPEADTPLMLMPERRTAPLASTRPARAPAIGLAAPGVTNQPGLYVTLTRDTHDLELFTTHPQQDAELPAIPDDRTPAARLADHLNHHTPPPTPPPTSPTTSAHDQPTTA